MTTEEWHRIEHQRIFFGHQSVGANILEGVRELAADNQANINIASSRNPVSIQQPALVEARLGRNGDPISKIQDFSAVLAHGMGAQGGIASFKLCFTDVDTFTNVDKLFAEYRAHVAKAKASYPHLTIVHVTMPLTVAEPGLKALAKAILRRTSERDLNAKRNRFNDLLRQEYGKDDPIFDLATVESTRSDGSRAFVGRKTDPVFVLAPEYTDDGSHLNRAGRRKAAIAFIRVLASAERSSQQ